MYDLPQIGLSGLNDFSLFVGYYEKKMNEQMYVDLSRIIMNRIIDNDAAPEICKQYVSNFEMNCVLNPHLEKYLSQIYETIKYPCSITLNNEAELEKMVLDAYNLSYMHYILGCEKNLKGSFPNYCCGISSNNLQYSLMSLGYPNALRVRNSEFDHDYVILPFIYKDQIGVVLADPTSDQLWKKHKNRPRNVVSVYLGNKWSYETDWKSGANLYPTKVEYFPEIIKSVDMEIFLKNAFSNPIELSVINQLFENYGDDFHGSDFGC